MIEVTVAFDEGSTADEKRQYIKDMYEWGVKNLIDQDYWQYLEFLYRAKINHQTTEISFIMHDEGDAVALKLRW